MKPTCCLLLTFYLLATHSVWAGQNPFVIHFPRDQYQAANRNYTICQDEKGLMYFGNDAGLLESDGIDWTLYGIPHSPAVHGVAVASHNTIFTGGRGEIGRWDRDLSGTLRYTSLNNLVKAGDIRKENILQVWIADNKVHFLSAYYIYVYNYQSILRIIPKTPIIYQLQVRGAYWIQGTTGAIRRLQGENLQEVEGSGFFKNTVVCTVLPHGTHDYLIGASNGDIYLYNGHSFHFWSRSLSAELSGKEVSCGIYSPHQNAYFFGTRRNGLYKVSPDGKILNHFTAESGLQCNEVLSLYEDRQNNIWVALEKGLAYLKYADNLSYFLADKYKEFTVHDATYWGDHLLLATERGVYQAPKSRLNEQGFFASLRLVEGTKGKAGLFTLSQGELYCAHSTGLLRIEADLSVTRPYPIYSHIYRVTDACIKGRDWLLLSTSNCPVFIDKATGIVHEMGQISDPVTNIETDHLENIWMETGIRGVYRCRLGQEPDAFNSCRYYGYEKQPILPSRLHIDKIGNRTIFFGNNQFFMYSERLDSLVPAPLLDKCFEPIEDLKRIVHSHGEENWAVGATSVHRFTYDGTGVRILGSYNIEAQKLSLVAPEENIAILNDSTSLFCLETGFILFRNRIHLPDSPQLPVPYIEAVGINTGSGESLFPDPTRVGDIPYNYGYVRVRYSASNAFAGDWRVECRLESNQLESRWRIVERNVVTYERLPEGEYTFKIRTTDRMGNYSPETSFSFRILPPWFFTTWAFVGYAVVLACLILLIWHIIAHRYRQLHLRQVRLSETRHLLNMNRKLLGEIEEKNAELFTQTSFIVRKNELMLKLREIVNEWYQKNNQKSLLPLYAKINQLLTIHLDEGEDWKLFLIKFEQKHHNFFKRLKADHPELTDNDLRLCACLKLNLETKDIASLMNLSVRGVENNRYRLRKKLKLSSTQSLNEYFLGIE